MKSNEIEKLRDIFNSEIINFSDSIFTQLLKYTKDDCFVILTQDILSFLDENFEDYPADWIEDYSYAIGETAYITYHGEPIFPLTTLKERIKESNNPENHLSFYTFNDIESSINGVSNNNGFNGIIDGFSHVEYDHFEDLFIYSALKMKNKK